ncbi:MAG: methyltransferase domain-containing protein [Candidatus Edwardsbacteria bacterium]|nr:methyltransferase domain-containing protein [Candidatus Edwardsbacteria bacterium]
MKGHSGVSEDEGFGTKFERHMMGKLLQGVAYKYDLCSVLESPADGVTGIPGANSLPLSGIVTKPVGLTNPSDLLLMYARETWAKRGLSDRMQTTQASVDKLPYDSGSFDLAWSFCMLERFRDPVSYLREISRVSNRLVLMVTLNHDNHGTWLHKIYHNATGLEWDHGDFDMMALPGIRRSFERSGIEVIATGAVDVPPTWDTWDMPLGGEISKIAGLFGRKWEWKAAPAKSRKGFLLSLFEWIEDNLPVWFKVLNAHHLYVLGRVGNNVE